ncbi:hypothetical protein ACFWDA_24675 [Rhodococcus zopfii]|uniref:hypothetical protein n=1 Tax=Rhodococcus zopfii TaxID=43772 RepID=UPI003656B880
MRLLLSAAIATSSLMLCGCGIIADAGEFSKSLAPKSQLCDDYCGELERLDDIRCTTSDVHTCASTLTEKVMLANSIDSALATEAMSDDLKRVHTKVDLISSPGERFGNNKCYEEGANQGDRLFRCREIAQDIDERFADLLEAVQELPA